MSFIIAANLLLPLEFLSGLCALFQEFSKAMQIYWRKLIWNGRKQFFAENAKKK